MQQEIESFLDGLEFGAYVPNQNDCDVMAVKARRALKEAYPELPTAVRIMFGVAFPRTVIRATSRRINWAFAGHGILSVDFPESDLHYDCTTADGKDGCRFRSRDWLKMWITYLQHGYVVFFWKDIWGDYEPY